MARADGDRVAHDGPELWGGLGIQPLKVSYENLAEAPEPVVRRVLGHLGIPVPAGLALEAPALRVQADDRSEEWVRRVLEHLAALEDPRAVPVPVPS